MTEKELESLIQLRKTVSTAFDELVAVINSEEFNQVDDLNKDVALTQAHTMQALLRTTAIRIGLNINSVRNQASPKEAEQPKEGPNEQRSTTEEESKPE